MYGFGIGKGKENTKAEDHEKGGSFKPFPEQQTKRPVGISTIISGNSIPEKIKPEPVDLPQYGTVSVSGDAHPGGWLVEAMYNRGQRTNLKNYNKGVTDMRKYLQDLQGKQADQANTDSLLSLNQLNADRQYGLGLFNADSTRIAANAASEQAKDKPIILGKGQTAFGPGGNPIASVPDQKEKEKDDTSLLDKLAHDIAKLKNKPGGLTPEDEETLKDLQRRYDEEYDRLYAPVPGARRGKDGNWYVLQPDGKYGKVV
ncbi:hypothetical protein MBAV_006196 [Candidatus Magnetobacterium bavaricum]|uniref:Uncharacterized protein n=1 Tax=Candidatus Magnetobacterium bavaricum TaxID=29290 RepID=A0A0F3GIE8_9BACT|nr:hypothetical protein MBAV_006196 [Candidatus Magnetobacterium bavaricum]